MVQHDLIMTRDLELVTVDTAPLLLSRTSVSQDLELLEVASDSSSPVKLPPDLSIQSFHAALAQTAGSRGRLARGPLLILCIHFEIN